MKGKLIVLYGINNLGKTTQAKMLVERLNFEGYEAEYLKYPVYELKPSGELLNGYLREGNPYNLSPREAQIIYAINRTQYEGELAKKLENGINIVAEDYTGTGLAWGIGAGVNEQFLKFINSHLLKEDIAFLFDGERFKEAVENEHKHECDNELTDKVRWTHLRLGNEFGWIKISANSSIDEIHSRIWDELLKVLNNFARKSQIENRKLLVERLSPIAKLPFRAHQYDAGLDLFSADYYSLMPGERVIIKTGVKMAIPDGCAGFIWDKGGIAKNGIHSMAGVVDAGFRGEITVNLINLSQDVYNIAPGQKIAQMIIQKIEFPEIIEEKIINETDRGEGCFGSTGLY